MGPTSCPGCIMRASNSLEAPMILILATVHALAMCAMLATEPCGAQQLEPPPFLRSADGIPATVGAQFVDATARHGWARDAVGSSPRQVVPGILEGRAAADRRAVGGRAVAGFMGGFLVGFFGPEAPAAPGFLLPVMAGATSIIVAAAAGSGMPDAATSPEIAGQGPDYTRVFGEAHSSRLRSRRGRAALLSGLGGMGAGLVGLVLAINAVCSSGRDC